MSKFSAVLAVLLGIVLIASVVGTAKEQGRQALLVEEQDLVVEELVYSLREIPERLHRKVAELSQAKVVAVEKDVVEAIRELEAAERSNRLLREDEVMALRQVDENLSRVMEHLKHKGKAKVVEKLGALLDKIDRLLRQEEAVMVEAG